MLGRRTDLREALLALVVSGIIPLVDSRRRLDLLSRVYVSDLLLHLVQSVTVTVLFGSVSAVPTETHAQLLRDHIPVSRPVQGCFMDVRTLCSTFGNVLLALVPAGV